MTVSGAVQEQLRLYPLSTLADIYKSFFQDEFGPGHLMSDPLNARAYYEKELSGMISRGRHRAEPCGRGRHFCRLPMDLVLDGLIPKEDYFDAFLAGADEFLLPEVGVWKASWCSVLASPGINFEGIDDFETDSLRILSLLDEGRYVLNHSDRYRRSYAPHYRIFSRSRAEALMATVYPMV